MAKAALPHMKPGSAILMTGFRHRDRSNKHLLDYSMTRRLHAFTRSLAAHLIERGIP